jgi:hypothetical protein
MKMECAFTLGPEKLAVTADNRENTGRQNRVYYRFSYQLQVVSGGVLVMSQQPYGFLPRHWGLASSAKPV